jgi:1,2-diacylglycerol 3-alpha-glucosyltransferase
MRVLLTTESFLPYLSGVTVSVDALARGLGAAGHEVLVLAPRPATGRPLPDIGSPGPDPRIAWVPSYQLPRVAPPGYRMPWPLPWTVGLRDVRAFRPDVVHAHSPFVTGLLARWIATRVGAPLVFTHHTRFGDYRHYLGPLGSLGARLTDAYLRRYWAASSAVIAPSRDLADEIAARLPASRQGGGHVVPTGVDVERIRATAPNDVRGPHGWGPETIVVATLGRLAPEKSVDELLDAFLRAGAADPRLRFLVIGGGPSEADLRRRAAADGLRGRVAFTGMLPRTEALATVAGADLFAFASRTETQGLVLAEALAAGVPAVAVDGPGVRDSVRDGVDGIVVAADPARTRPDRLGEAIAGLAADADRRGELRRRAAEDAGRFDVVRRVAETIAVYRSVIG